MSEITNRLGRIRRMLVECESDLHDLTDWSAVNADDNLDALVDARYALDNMIADGGDVRNVNAMARLVGVRDDIDDAIRIAKAGDDPVGVETTVRPESTPTASSTYKPRHLTRAESDVDLVTDGDWPVGR